MNKLVIGFIGYLLFMAYPLKVQSEILHKQRNIESLDDIRWEVRIVVTVVQSNSELEKIKTFYSDNLTEFQERRLLIIVFDERIFQGDFFQNHFFQDHAFQDGTVQNNLCQDNVRQDNRVSTLPSSYTLSSHLCSELLQMLNKNQTLLLGLDGGVKRRYALLNWTEVFQHIDSMPMRRAEIENKD